MSAYSIRQTHELTCAEQQPGPGLDFHTPPFDYWKEHHSPISRLVIVQDSARARTAGASRDPRLTADQQERLPQGSASKLESVAKVASWVAKAVEGEDGSRQGWVLGVAGQEVSRQEDPGVRACVDDAQQGIIKEVSTVDASVACSTSKS